MTNKCPKCKYNFVHRTDKKEVYIEKNVDASKASKFNVTTSKAKRYECKKCGWSKTV
jgi:hypothetical protein